MYITKTSFNKNDNPLPEFKDVIKIKDISFGLDNILKAAELSFKNQWFDMLYKCSQAMWCIIEPWFILHYDFSKIFVSYISAICNFLEKANISDFEWDIFLHFKLSKTLYISSTISKDMKYINAITVSKNVPIKPNINKSLKNILNNVRNTLKINQNQNQNQASSSNTNTNTNNKNNEKSIFFNIVTLHPELHNTVVSLLKKSTQVSQNFIDDSIKNIEKAINISLQYAQDKYLELYKFYIYILKKEKPDQLNVLKRYIGNDKNLKIKAIYVMIQNLNFSNNVTNEKLNDINKQINSLITSNSSMLFIESRDNILYESNGSIPNVNINPSKNQYNNQLIFYGWNEVLILIEFCQLSLKIKNFQMAEKAIKTISKFKQLTFSQYAKYQLLLAEYIFNISMNKIEDILCEKAIKLRLNFLNKLLKMINYYVKSGNSPNIIQECIIKVWEYGIPLLQPQYKQHFYPSLKRCYDVLIQINSPLYSLTSVICKELAKYNDEISNITDAKLYIKNAYKYCFDKKKIEESFEYKNIELKLKASSMENTTFSKIEEALAMINHINLKTKNVDELKMSLYKILKILIPKHENHLITSIYPLMDQNFDIDFELENDNISQLKFFIEVLKQLMQHCCKIKYWELLYEITSYIICHDYSKFPEHEPYFKVVICEALIKRLEALSNIKNDILNKNIENKNDSKNKEDNKNIINTNTLIYLLLNPNIIKIDKEEIDMENENNIEKTTKPEKKDNKKSQENDKQNSKKQENEKQNYYNEICEILKIYGNNISSLKKTNLLEKIYFNENDTFYSSTGSLNLENLEFIFEIISILELAIATNSQW